MRSNYYFFGTMRIGRATAFAFGAMVIAALLFGLLITAKPAHAAATTFTVNSTGDENDLDFPGGTFDGSSDGKCDVDSSTTGNQCTLRAAIQQANKHSGADTIKFNIPSSDTNCDTTTHVCTIAVGSEPPQITQQVTIDGYTQGDATSDTADDATENTIPLTEAGTNAALKIELYPDGPTDNGLSIGNSSSNVVIRGLVINQFGQGIRTRGGTGHKVEGNFIGTDPSGTIKKSNSFGVIVGGTNGSTIGGTTPDKRNLISGNLSEGVLVGHDSSRGSSGNTIEGNLIGTDKDGNPLGNGMNGVELEFNGAIDTGNRILSNSIFSNGLLGIDLSNNGVTANDPKDPDTGPNRLQNYPLITSAQNIGDFTSINGTLNSTPSTKKKTRIFIIQFFSSPSEDPSHFGEGQTFIGQTQVQTDRQGDASFSFAPFQKVPTGRFITATATNKKTGDTSEFSQANDVDDLGGG
jgi:hypothetical protein